MVDATCARQQPLQLSLKTVVLCAFVLFTADLVFFALHLAHDADRSTEAGSMWRVDVDRSYPELFQYLKFGLTAVGLAVLARLRHLSAAGVWAVLFALFAVDDAFSVHEEVGEFLAEALRLPSVAGLRSVDLGEVLYAAGIGLALLIAAAWTWQSEDRRNRWLHIRLAALVGGLALFAVVVDTAHMLPIMASIPGFGLLEDGGEMLIGSATLAFVAGVVAGSVMTTPSALVCDPVEI